MTARAECFRSEAVQHPHRDDHFRARLSERRTGPEVGRTEGWPGELSPAAAERRSWAPRVKMSCGECGCVVDRGGRLEMCGDDGCCCAELPVADEDEAEYRPVQGFPT